MTAADQRPTGGRRVGGGWVALGLGGALLLASWLTALWVGSITGPAAAITTTPTAVTTPDPTPSQTPTPTPTPTSTPTPARGATETTVEFAPGVVGLATMSLPDLNTVAIHLKADGATVATVVGLPDPSGPGANQNVAQTRAHNVADYLIRRGVAQNQVVHTVTTVSRGGSGGTVVGAQVLIGQVLTGRAD